MTALMTGVSNCCFVDECGTTVMKRAALVTAVLAGESNCYLVDDCGENSEDDGCPCERINDRCK